MNTKNIYLNGIKKMDLVLDHLNCTKGLMP